MIKKIGPVNARKMIAAFGSVEAVFNEGPEHLSKWKIHRDVAIQLRDPELFNHADREIEFIASNKITAISVFDEEYPIRL